MLNFCVNWFIWIEFSCIIESIALFIGNLSGYLKNSLIIRLTIHKSHTIPVSLAKCMLSSLNIGICDCDDEHLGKYWFRLPFFHRALSVSACVCLCVCLVINIIMVAAFFIYAQKDTYIVKGREQFFLHVTILIN